MATLELTTDATLAISNVPLGEFLLQVDQAAGKVLTLPAGLLVDDLLAAIVATFFNRQWDPFRHRRALGRAMEPAAKAAADRAERNQISLTGCKSPDPQTVEDWRPIINIRCPTFQA